MSFPVDHRFTDDDGGTKITLRLEVLSPVTVKGTVTVVVLILDVSPVFSDSSEDDVGS